MAWPHSGAGPSPVRLGSTLRSKTGDGKVNKQPKVLVEKKVLVLTLPAQELELGMLG